MENPNIEAHWNNPTNLTLLLMPNKNFVTPCYVTKGGSHFDTLIGSVGKMIFTINVDWVNMVVEIIRETSPHRVGA